MADIISLPLKTRRERSKPKRHLFVPSPLDSEKPLGVVDDFGSHVVVHPAPGSRVRRRYVVDTPIEGARLLLRLHGLHQAMVAHTDKGIVIYMPPLAAGEAPHA